MTPLHSGLPLRHYYADRYTCLDDHRLAHPVNQPSCDCMRRPRRSTFTAVTYTIGQLIFWGGAVVGGWVEALGERRKKERLERR